MEKTKEELQLEIDFRNRLEKEREHSDRLYAIKLVEKAVFAILTILFLGAVGYLIRIALNN
jgi:hypothetical protein